jgi:HAD superfamily hydrolase (TIGR01509 family)
VAFLLDVGGTLWPDGPRKAGILGIESRYLGHAAFLAAGAARLEALGVAAAHAAALAAALADDAEERASIRQNTLGHVRRVLRANRSQLDPPKVLDAMCVPAREVLDPFPGALELLHDLKGAGHRLALVSNTQWRSAARYREDFAGWGAAECFDAYVTSLDVGFRKPHAAMFEHALELLGVEAEQAVMVGDSPTKDVAPARKLGMRAVLVAIQTSPPDDAQGADEVVASIGQLREVLLGHVR